MRTRVIFVFCFCIGFLFGNTEIENLQKQCDLGDGLGCSNLGVMYAEGIGAKKDLSRAKELYGKACDLKEQLGCKNYAKMP